MMRRLWTEDAPFDFDGEFFRYEAAFSSVKPVTPAGSRCTSPGPHRPPSRSAPPKPTSTPSGGNPGRGGRPDGAIDDARPRSGAAFATASRCAPSSPTPKRRRGRRPSGSRPRRPRDRAGQGANGGHKDEYADWAAATNAAFSVDRDTSGTTRSGANVSSRCRRPGRPRRAAVDEGGQPHRRRGQLHRAGGHADQVAEAMLRYYDLGVTTLLLKGFDPLVDVIDFGERLLPLVRKGAELRDAAPVR